MSQLPIISNKINVSLHDIVDNITHNDISGVNILFINLPLRESAQPNTTPEGPLLMATNLRNNYGVKASIVDLNAYRIKDEQALARGLPGGRHLTHDEAKELIKKHISVHGEPDVVGLSGKITTFKWQKTIVEIIRGLIPDMFIVSGGGLATELKLGLFNYIPELDGIATSEGDDIIIKICYDARTIKQYGLESAINSGKLAPYYIGTINDKHRLMYIGDRPDNLDAFPFADLDLIKKDVYGNPLLEWYIKTPVWGGAANNSSATSFTMNRSTTSVSSRGCPFSCAFCFRGAQGERNWGIRSAKHIHNEMLHHIEKYNIDFKGFSDDNFAVAINRIEDMVPLLGPLKLPWGTHCRLDEGADLRRIKPMAQAGCAYIGFGAESANSDSLIELNKGGHTLSMGFENISINGKEYSFPKSMTTAIRNCIEYGIHANCTWIMGINGETLERLKYSVAFIKWQEELYAQNGVSTDAVNKKIFTLTWYPGTGIIANANVRQKLTDIFGITFKPSANKTSPFEPVYDQSFYDYLITLDDATKVLKQGEETLNFSNMPLDTFLQAREYVDSGNIFKILEMNE